MSTNDRDNTPEPIACPCGCGTTWAATEAHDKCGAFALSHPDEARSHPASDGLGSGLTRATTTTT